MWMLIRKLSAFVVSWNLLENEHNWLFLANILKFATFGEGRIHLALIFPQFHLPLFFALNGSSINLS